MRQTNDIQQDCTDSGDQESLRSCDSTPVHVCTIRRIQHMFGSHNLTCSHHSSSLYVAIVQASTYIDTLRTELAIYIIVKVYIKAIIKIFK